MGGLDAPLDSTRCLIKLVTINVLEALGGFFVRQAWEMREKRTKEIKAQNVKIANKHAHFGKSKKPLLPLNIYVLKIEIKEFVVSLCLNLSLFW